MIPHFKIETNSQTIEDDLATTIEVVLPENDVGYSVLSATDYQSVNYIDLLDAFNQLDISIKRNSGSYTKIFSGHISNLRPHLDISGEILFCSAWDFGKAFDKTHCDTSYGIESENPSKETIMEIAQDLIYFYVNQYLKSGNTTYWGIDSSTIENVLSALLITSLPSPYFTCKEVINRLCSLGSAYAAANATVGPHWRMKGDQIIMKLINADSIHDASWTRYWGGSQLAATIEVAIDQILYDFQDNIEEYANHILLSSTLRKPATDIWCEDGGPTWGDVAVTPAHEPLWAYSSAQHIVGSHSLKLNDPIGNPGGGGFAFYPATAPAHWNFDACGSPKTIPHLNFYVRSNSTNFFDNFIHLTRNDPNDIGWGGFVDTWSFQLDDFITPAANKWFHISVPIGSYWASDPAISSANWSWIAAGTPPLWSDVNYIAIEVDTDAGTTGYIDDLHFSGQIMREAKDTSEITSAKKDRQHFIRLDSATDDTLLATNDSGTAAQLAYAELLRRARRSIVGRIDVPGNETILPGQTVHIHSCKKSDSSLRINKDMRIKEVRHRISVDGFITQLDLTDDVSNSLAFGVPDNYSLLKEYAMALGHAEAKDLKASGVDTLIPRLSNNY